MTHKIAILGASGYTGAELVRLIATHPAMEIVALSADRKAGMTMAEVFPFLRHLDLPTLVKIDEIDFTNVDLCFCALPHATTQEVIAKLPRDLKIVDLSCRLSASVTRRSIRSWYGQPHAAARFAEGGGLRPDRVLPRRDPRGAAGGWHWVQRGDRAVCAASR